MNEKLKETILANARPLAEARGLLVWGLDASDGLARLYVDAPAGGEAPTIDQCEEISRALGAALDVEDVFPGAWTLEVSTPGLERKFFTLEQTRPYVGDFIETLLVSPLGDDGRKAYRGKLIDVDEDSFTLQPYAITGDGEAVREDLPEVRVPWSKVRRARRIHLFQVPRKPGKCRARKA